VLREAHLDPQRTTITVTLESADGTAPKAPPLQYAINTPSYDEYPRATYSVAGGRAISTSMEPMRSRHRSAQDPAATS